MSRLLRYRHVIISGVPRRDDNLLRVITSITSSASLFRRASFVPRFTAYRACHCFPTVMPVHRDGAAACRFCHWPTANGWAARGTSTIDRALRRENSFRKFTYVFPVARTRSLLFLVFQSISETQLAKLCVLESRWRFGGLRIEN